jgi:hypothetical protein
MMSAMEGEGALDLIALASVLLGWAFILACLVALVVFAVRLLRRKK